MQCRATPVPGDVATNRMISEAVNAPVPQLKINGLTGDSNAMHDGAATTVEVQTLLSDGGAAQNKKAGMAN